MSENALYSERQARLVLAGMISQRSVLSRSSLTLSVRFRLLAILPLLTAPLSVAGSSLIIYTILAERRKKLEGVYHRLMLGMSTADFISSLSMIVLGPWAVAQDASEFSPGARGNVRTCDASGFFLILGSGSMW
jgi:hypothetical protein